MAEVLLKVSLLGENILLKCSPYKKYHRSIHEINCKDGFILGRNVIFFSLVNSSVTFLVLK